MLEREYQVPIFTPHNVPVYYLKLPKIPLLQVLIILWVGMSTYKVANVDTLSCIVAECDANRQFSYIFYFSYLHGQIRFLMIASVGDGVEGDEDVAQGGGGGVAAQVEAVAAAREGDGFDVGGGNVDGRR